MQTPENPVNSTQVPSGSTSTSKPSLAELAEARKQRKSQQAASAPAAPQAAPTQSPAMQIPTGRAPTEPQPTTFSSYVDEQRGSMEMNEEVANIMGIWGEPSVLRSTRPIAESIAETLGEGIDINDTSPSWVNMAKAAFIAQTYSEVSRFGFKKENPMTEDEVKKYLWSAAVLRRSSEERSFVGTKIPAEIEKFVASLPAHILTDPIVTMGELVAFWMASGTTSSVLGAAGLGGSALPAGAGLGRAAVELGKRGAAALTAETAGLYAAGAVGAVAVGEEIPGVGQAAETAAEFAAFRKVAGAGVKFGGVGLAAGATFIPRFMDWATNRGKGKTKGMDVNEVVEQFLRRRNGEKPQEEYNVARVKSDEALNNYKERNGITEEYTEATNDVKVISATAEEVTGQTASAEELRRALLPEAGIEFEPEKIGSQTLEFAQRFIESFPTERARINEIAREIRQLKKEMKGLPQATEEMTNRLEELRAERKGIIEQIGRSEYFKGVQAERTVSGGAGISVLSTVRAAKTKELKKVTKKLKTASKNLKAIQEKIATKEEMKVREVQRDIMRLNNTIKELREKRVAFKKRQRESLKREREALSEQRAQVEAKQIKAADAQMREIMSRVEQLNDEIIKLEKEYGEPARDFTEYISKQKAKFEKILEQIEEKTKKDIEVAQEKMQKQKMKIEKQISKLEAKLEKVQGAERREIESEIKKLKKDEDKLKAKAEKIQTTAEKRMEKFDKMVEEKVAKIEGALNRKAKSIVTKAKARLEQERTERKREIERQRTAVLKELENLEAEKEKVGEEPKSKMLKYIEKEKKAAEEKIQTLQENEQKIADQKTKVLNAQKQKIEKEIANLERESKKAEKNKQKEIQKEIDEKRAEMKEIDRKAEALTRQVEKRVFEERKALQKQIDRLNAELRNVESESIQLLNSQIKAAEKQFADLEAKLKELESEAADRDPFIRERRLELAQDVLTKQAEKLQQQIDLVARSSRIEKIYLEAQDINNEMRKQNVLDKYRDTRVTHISSNALEQEGLMRVSGATKAYFDQNYALKSPEEASLYLAELHKAAWENATPKEKVSHYIMIPIHGEHNATYLENIYASSGLLEGTGFENLSQYNWRAMASDPEFKKLFYEYHVEKKALPDYTPVTIKKLFENFDKMNIRAASDARRFGIEQHVRPGHVSQSMNPYEMSIKGKEEYVKDALEHYDWNEIDITYPEGATPEMKLAEQTLYAGAVYDNIMEKYGGFNFQNLNDGLGNKGERVITYKGFESWDAMMQKYGHRRSPMEAEFVKAKTMARRNGIASVMGGKPELFMRTLIEDANKLLIAEGKRIKEIQSLEGIKAVGQKISAWWETDAFLPYRDLKARRNMLERQYNALFKIAGRDNFTTSNTYTLANYLLSTQTSAATINSTLYPYLDIPIYAELEAARTYDTSKVKALVKGIGRANKPNAPVSDLVKFGSAYNLNNQIYPDLYTPQITKDAGKFARVSKSILDTYNKFLNGIRGSDSFQLRNYSMASLQWNNKLGDFLQRNLSFEQLPRGMQELFNKMDINAADWETLRQNRKLLLETEYPFAGEESLDLALLPNHHFTPINNLGKRAVIQDRNLYNTIHKFLAAEAKQVDLETKDVTYSMKGAFLGEYTKKQDPASALYRQLFDLKGWSMRQYFDMIESGNFQIRGGNQYTKLKDFVLFKYTSALMMGKIRWLAAGKEAKDYETVLWDAVERAGVFYGAESVIQSLYVSLSEGNMNSVLDALTGSKSVGRGTVGISLGVGVQNTIKIATDIFNAKAKDNRRKCGAVLRSVTPFEKTLDNSMATSFLYNRIFMDHILARTSPAAYACMQEEIKRNAHSKHRYKEGFEPGSFVP